MMKNKLQALPHFFTLSNLFLGFWAILFVSRDNFVLAAVCIIFAGICDDLDGRVARLTKSFSKFGKELDSLADSISFGVAPAFLVYQSNFSEIGPWGTVFCFIFLLSGIFRLARFNVITKGFKKSVYKGLPIPIAAVTIATFILFADTYFNTVKIQNVFLILIPGLSLLMVSSIGYEPIPKINFNRSLKSNIKPLAYFISFVFIFFFPKQLFFPCVLAYIFNGIIMSLYALLRADNDAAETQVDEEKIVK